jgi:hypothetical protein
MSCSSVYPTPSCLGVDAVPDDPIGVFVETRRPRPVYVRYGTAAAVKERRVVELMDLPVFGPQHGWVAQAAEFEAR